MPIEQLKTNFIKTGFHCSPFGIECLVYMIWDRSHILDPITYWLASFSPALSQLAQNKYDVVLFIYLHFQILHFYYYRLRRIYTFIFINCKDANLMRFSVINCTENDAREFTSCVPLSLRRRVHRIVEAEHSLSRLHTKYVTKIRCNRISVGTNWNRCDNDLSCDSQFV